MRHRKSVISSPLLLLAGAGLFGIMLMGGACGIDEGITQASEMDESNESHEFEELSGQDRAIDDPDDLIARYGVFCIRNRTNHGTINYAIRWGDGPWKDYSVTGSRWHSWRYATPGRPDSPTPRIRFDSDFTGGTSWVTYRLRPTPLPEQTCTGATLYHFIDEGETGRYIDLIEIV